MRCIDKGYAAHDFTYAALHTLTNRFANVLQTLDIAKGDALFVLAPRIPDISTLESDEQ